MGLSDPVIYLRVKSIYYVRNYVPAVFLMKMQLYCEKMVTNESFKVLPILSYNFCPSFW